jgi:hypothetical protein
MKKTTKSKTERKGNDSHHSILKFLVKKYIGDYKVIQRAAARARKQANNGKKENFTCEDSQSDLYKQIGQFVFQEQSKFKAILKDNPNTKKHAIANLRNLLIHLAHLTLENIHDATLGYNASRMIGTLKWGPKTEEALRERERSEFYILGYQHGCKEYLRKHPPLQGEKNSPISIETDKALSSNPTSKDEALSQSMGEATESESESESADLMLAEDEPTPILFGYNSTKNQMKRKYDEMAKDAELNYNLSPGFMNKNSLKL